MEYTEWCAIERLPSVVVVEIGRHLTVEQLSVCCAASRRMRQLFGDDVLWKPHCDQDLAEHLRVTPCQVQPVFTSPEEEDTSLSPICHWRLAYMRENHFYNNWRQGRFREVEHQHTDVLHCSILSDHYAVLWCKDKIEIVDISHVEFTSGTSTFDPIPRKDSYYTQPYNFELGHGSLYNVETSRNMILAMYDFVIEVYHLDFDNCKWTLEHRLEMGNMQRYRRFHCRDKYTVVDKLLVGFTRHASDVDDTLLEHETLVIWDLVSGVKVKEEPVFENCVIKEIVSGDSPNIVVVGHFRTTGNICLVYSLTEFKYFPLRVNTSREAYGCTLCGDFVYIPSPGYHINIYNYRTAELILEMKPFSVVTVVNNYFMFFNRCGGVSMFDTLTRQILTFDLGQKVCNCIPLSRRLAMLMIQSQNVSETHWVAFCEFDFKNKKIKKTKSLCKLRTHIISESTFNKPATMSLFKNWYIYYW